MAESDSKGQMKHTETQFDAYLMVDWGAANEPKDGPDSVWYSFYDRPDGAWTTKNHRTRQEATDGIASILYETTKREKAVLGGFDFAFGYPAGFGSALGWHGKSPWRALCMHLLPRLAPWATGCRPSFDGLQGSHEP